MIERKAYQEADFCIAFDGKKQGCRICQRDLVRYRYIGSNPEILACYGSVRKPREKLDFLADIVENGRSVWIADSKDRWSASVSARDKRTMSLTLVKS